MIVIYCIDYTIHMLHPMRLIPKEYFGYPFLLFGHSFLLYCIIITGAHYYFVICATHPSVKVRLYLVRPSISSWTHSNGHIQRRPTLEIYKSARPIIAHTIHHISSQIVYRSTQWSQARNYPLLYIHCTQQSAGLYSDFVLIFIRSSPSVTRPLGTEKRIKTNGNGYRAKEKEKKRKNVYSMYREGMFDSVPSHNTIVLIIGTLWQGYNSHLQDVMNIWFPAVTSNVESLNSCILYMSVASLFVRCCPFLSECIGYIGIRPFIISLADYVLYIDVDI